MSGLVGYCIWLPGLRTTQTLLGWLCTVMPRSFHDGPNEFIEGLPLTVVQPCRLGNRNPWLQLPPRLLCKRAQFPHIQIQSRSQSRERLLWRPAAVLALHVLGDGGSVDRVACTLRLVADGVDAPLALGVCQAGG